MDAAVSRKQYKIETWLLQITMIFIVAVLLSYHATDDSVCDSFLLVITDLYTIWGSGVTLVIKVRGPSKIFDLMYLKSGGPSSHSKNGVSKSPAP